MSAAIERRVLVTGATGLLGRQVVRVFQDNKWSVRGLGFSRATGSIVKCDIFDTAQLTKQFEAFKPTIVVHCAAERRPDNLEGKKEEAARINGTLVRTMGELCVQSGSWLIHISTNYVFDGKKAPYAEDAQTCPVNEYGISKLLGETELAKVFPQAAIVRVPLLFGPIQYVEETSVTTLLNTIKQPDPKLDDWQERFPTSTEDVAQVLQALAAAYCTASDRSKFQGIFHWQSNKRETKYTMAVAIADIAQIDARRFIRVDTAPPPGSAPRPQFERMTCAKLETLLGINAGSSRYRSDFRASLRKYMQPHIKRSLFARLFSKCGWCG